MDLSLVIPLYNEVPVLESSIKEIINVLNKTRYVYEIILVDDKSKDRTVEFAKEIVRKNKFYFYDTGIRNAVIANFNRIEIRNDIGQLWENFLIVECIKKKKYQEAKQGILC